MIGNCERIKHDSTNGLYRMLADFCPAMGRIAIHNPGLVPCGAMSLGIMRSIDGQTILGQP